MHPVEEFSRALGLVGLQMPDQMPDRRQVRQRGALVHCLLHAVFAKVVHARLVGTTNQRGRDGLGNGDQFYPLRRAPGAATSCCNPLPNAGDVILQFHVWSVVRCPSSVVRCNLFTARCRSLRWSPIKDGETFYHSSGSSILGCRAAVPNGNLSVPFSR